MSKPGPTPDEWRILSSLLDEALDRDDAERVRWMEHLRLEQPEMAAQVAQLLSARDAASRDGFLDGTATPLPESGGRPGAVCGPYVLESLIGRGGMGSVWRATRRDGRYDAVVAVKVLSTSRLGDDGARRFRREGQILARLHHPHIAQLLDAGISDDGQPFLVLEHVDGAHIDAWCRAERLDVRARVHLMRDVLAAVAHAHASLVVHRDLKPSNILVNAEGQVKLLDFGIAKLIELESDGDQAITALTRDGSALHTPLYASPEQITGGDITTATDVYALGVVLYELLVGARPYRLSRETPGALEHAILTADPERPSERTELVHDQRVLRGDLDTIILKALRKAPADRYATVTALADDLTAWLEGRPVRARPDALSYRAARFVRRHAVAVSAAAMVVVAVVGGAGVAFWQASVARGEQRRAEEVTAFITDIFRNADPYLGDGTALTAVELLKQANARLAGSLIDRPDLRYELTWLIGSSLGSLQAYSAAEPILHAADSMARTLFAPGDPERLRLQVALSGLYRARGQLDNMDTVLAHTLATLRAQSQPDHAVLIAALVDSSHLAIDRGQAAQAVPPVREADMRARRDLPANHELRVTAAQVLAVALENDGQNPDESLTAAEHAVAVTRAHYGGNASHPRVVEGQMLLGRALGRVGRTQDAIVVLRQADSASLLSMGPESYTRAFLLASMANYERELWRDAEALAHYDHARQLLRVNGDTSSVSYGIVQANRGNLLLRLGRNQEAVNVFNEAIALLIPVWGADHPNLAVHRIRYAHTQAALGRTQPALQQLAAVATDTSAFPRATMTLLHHTTGIVRRMNAQAREAVAAQQRALALTTDSTTMLGQRSRAPVLAELALALHANQQRDLAQAAAVAARQAFQDGGITEVPSTIAQAWRGANLR